MIIFIFIVENNSLIVLMLHAFSKWNQFAWKVTQPYCYIFQTFQGNVDTSTIKSNPLGTPVTALCLQLYPLAFVDVPNVRLEVKGCPLA